MKKYQLPTISNKNQELVNLKRGAKTESLMAKTEGTKSKPEGLLKHKRMRA